MADNTDVYAFVSPDRPDTVTLIANFIPFEGPAGGPASGIADGTSNTNAPYLTSFPYLGTPAGGFQSLPGTRGSEDLVNSENPYAGQGAVLLDIGGDVGALVVTMPAVLDGAEVEIRPRSELGRGARTAAQHEHHHHPHVAVVARPVAGGRIHSLVFPELEEGVYELYVRPSGPVELVASVRGGSVTEAVWPPAVLSSDGARPART